MSNSQERFLSDNPYRALCIGSAETIASVRRKADAAEKRAKVGLDPDVPLTGLLGRPSLEDLPQFLRALTTDSKRRTCYRIMWPLSASGIPLLLDGGKVRTGQMSMEELRQVLFLASWLSFLETRSPEDGSEALKRWEDLYTTEKMDERLIELLVQEGETDRDLAYDAVLDAQRTVALSLVRKVSAEATVLLDGGQVSRAVLLIEAVVKSPINDDLKTHGLDSIADTGHRLKDRVELSINELGEWRRGLSTEPPNEAVLLESLAMALSGHLPSALDWQETAQRWTTTLVWRMRKESLRLNQEDDNSGALEVSRAALKLANTTEQKAKLKEDIGLLVKNVADEETEAAYAGIKKIRSTPPLGTLNGIGFKLYGRESFPADRRYYFTILYFTVAFIPFIPLGRFLVKDGDGGGWHFIGKTRWSQLMKIHLGSLCFLMCLIWVFLNNSNWTSSSTISSLSSNSIQQSGSYPNSTISMPAVVADEMPGQGVATSPPTSPTSNEDSKRFAEQSLKEKRRDKLEKELNNVKAQLENLRSEIKDEMVLLTEKRSTLSDLGSEIRAGDPNPYSQEEIDAYNAKVQRHKGLLSEYNKLVDKYNRKVNKEKVLVRRYNDIVDAINTSR